MQDNQRSIKVEATGGEKIFNDVVYYHNIIIIQKGAYTYLFLYLRRMPHKYTLSKEQMID